MSSDEEPRAKTATLTRMLNHLGLIGMFGHVSIRVPGTDTCFISPGASNAATWVNPSFFSTGLYRHYLRRGETILPIRWGWLSESPMWQAETHMYFNLASGYFTTAIPPGWVSSLTNDLWADTPHLGDATLIRPLVAQRHISDIVVEDTEVKAWAPVLRRAGLHATATVGGVTLYHIPAAWLAGRHATA